MAAKTYLGTDLVNKAYLGSTKVGNSAPAVNYLPILGTGNGLRYQWDQISGSTSDTWKEQVSGSDLSVAVGAAGSMTYVDSPNYLTSGYYLPVAPTPNTDRAYLYGDDVKMYSHYTFTFGRTFQWWMYRSTNTQTNCQTLFGLYSGAPGAEIANFKFIIDPFLDGTVAGSYGPGIVMVGGTNATTDSVAPYSILPTSSLVTGDWANYAITWNHPTTGINTNHTLTVYVNGVQEGQWVGEFDNDASPPATDYEHWMVAATNNPSGYSPTGNIQNTRFSQLLVYDAVLSPSQIQQNMNATAYLYNRA